MVSGIDKDVKSPPLFDDNSVTRLARVMKALSNPHNIRILELFATQSQGQEISTHMIESCLGITDSTRSNYLEDLEAAGLITRKRGHRTMFISSDGAALRSTIAALLHLGRKARWIQSDGGKAALAQTPEQSPNLPSDSQAIEQKTPPPAST